MLVWAHLGLLFAGCSRSTIFTGGPVLTMDGEAVSRTGLAVIVKGDEILAVSPLADIEEHVLRKSNVVDLQGRLLMPGIVESHGHLFGLGTSIMGLDLRGTESKQEALQAVSLALADLKDGEWLFGSGWDQTAWSENSFPTAAELDSVAPANPVALTRIGGHTLWVNSPALEAAGITAATKDPDGGRIDRDESGSPTGILLDNAAQLPPEIEEKRNANPVRMLRAAQNEAFRNGVTTFHDLAFPSEYLPVYSWLYRLGLMNINLRVYVMADDSIDGYLQSHGPRALRDDRLRIGAVKVFMDGAMGSYGALLHHPYSDRPEEHGLQVTGDERLREIAGIARDEGWQLAVHAIGDAANTKVLDAFEEVIGQDAGHEYRWRIEHAQFIRPEDIPRFAAGNYIASMQPRHATTDMRWVFSRIGAERARTSYAWRSLMDAGTLVVGGSDTPVEPVDPFWGMYAAVTRQDFKGDPEEGFIPRERVTREEALAMYTVWGAFAGFDENRIGKLAPGYQADMIIVDRDVSRVPAPELIETAVEATYVRGRRVYRRESE